MNHIHVAALTQGRCQLKEQKRSHTSPGCQSLGSPRLRVRGDIFYKQGLTRCWSNGALLIHLITLEDHILITLHNRSRIIWLLLIWWSSRIILRRDKLSLDLFPHAFTSQQSMVSKCFLFSEGFEDVAPSLAKLLEGFLRSVNLCMKTIRKQRGKMG